QENADEDNCQKLGARRPIRPIEERLPENLLGRLRMDGDTGDEFIERCRPGVEQARGRGTDIYNVSLDALLDRRGLRGVEHVFRGHITVGAVAVEVDPDLAVTGQRHGEVADAHVDQRMPTAADFTAGAAAAQDHALLLLRDAQRLYDKAR